jgi:tetratricopeptide (TPR) repeat protein
MRIGVLACAIVAALTVHGPASAAGLQDYQDCNASDVERRITGCTRVIQDQREPAGNRAISLMQRGAAHHETGELDRAIADYDEAVRLDPGLALAYYRRGNVHRDKRDLDRAIADLDEAIRLEPGLTLAYHHRGLAYRDKGDFGRALDDFDAAVRLDPKFAAAYHQRAGLREDRGDRAGADADFAEAARLDPKFARAPSAPAPAAMPVTTAALPVTPAPPAAAAPAPAALAAATVPHKLSGRAAWNALLGNSIIGKENGKTLVEYYAPDGTAKSMTGNELSTGKWTFADETVCFKYTDEPAPECYKVEVSGNTVTYYEKDGSGSRYRILKGNPRRL